MARQYDDNYAPYRPQHSGAGWVMTLAFVAAVVAFVAFLYPDLAHMPGLPERAKGNQAPAERRGSFGGSDTYQPADIPATNGAINAYNATAEARYQQAIEQGDVAAPMPVQPTLRPLPLNSAGEPVISQEQQRQMQQSLVLAEQEGNAAADQALANQRAAAEADAASRQPDVSYEEAKALLGRDPCSVPRANPHTCARGLFKPTPVN